MILTLLHVSARKLGLDADGVFYEDARALAYEPVKERDYFVNAGARLLRSYAGRPDRDNCLMSPETPPRRIGPV